MERPTFKPIGTPSTEFDTPALVVDIDALESNIATVHGAVDRAGVRIRPRLDAHLCAAIGHMQLSAPGTRGVAVSTLGQAEVFSQNGFDDILVANLVVTPTKIRRAAALARRVRLVVETDSEANIDNLAAAAADAGSVVGVAIAVRGSAPTVGVLPADAPILAREIDAAPSLEFAGVVSAGQGEAVIEAADACRDGGLPASMVAGGGSATYDGAASLGITDMLAGSYALNDGSLAGRRPELKVAARLLTTVMTHQDEGLVWLDAGQKATSIDTGLPVVDGIEGASVSRMSAEHGAMVLESGSEWDVDLGSKVWLIPDNIANTVNVYDFMHATRDGKLDAVWEVSARGQYN